MEANELRLGNYVNKLGVDLVVGIDDIRDIIVDNDFDIEQFAPIPLTHEKLLELGFEFDDYEDYDFEFFSIRKEGNVFYYNPITEYYESMRIKIDYVHQLQNLYFALNNQEITINK